MERATCVGESGSVASGVVGRSGTRFGLKRDAEGAVRTHRSVRWSGGSVPTSNRLGASPLPLHRSGERNSPMGASASGEKSLSRAKTSREFSAS